MFNCVDNTISQIGMTQQIRDNESVSIYKMQTKPGRGVRMSGVVTLHVDVKGDNHPGLA